MFPFKQYKDYNTWSTTFLPAFFAQKIKIHLVVTASVLASLRPLQPGSCWCPFFTNGRPHFFLTFWSRPGLGLSHSKVRQRPPMLKHFQQVRSTGTVYSTHQGVPVAPVNTNSSWCPTIHCSWSDQAISWSWRETCREKVLCLPSFILQTCTHISNKISSSIESGNKIIDSSDDVSQWGPEIQ